MKLIDKDTVMAEIENLLDKGRYHEEYDCAYRDGNNGALDALKNKLDTIEVKEVKEIPANVMLNQFGNKYISSWSGLKEYNNFQINEKIKILIPNKQL